MGLKSIYRELIEQKSLKWKIESADQKVTLNTEIGRVSTHILIVTEEGLLQSFM